MQITHTYDPVRHIRRYELEISDFDLLHARLDDFDRFLLKECETGTVADWLLALETIARRIEQAQAQRQKPIISELPSSELGETEAWFVAV